MSTATPDWDQLLPKAMDQIRPAELVLLRRLAEARGRRVPISELANSFGLPSAPHLEHDFPGLHQFINDRKSEGETIAMPVEASGTDDKGWYWMAPQISGAFRRQLAAAETGPSSSPSAQPADQHTGPA